MCPAHESDLGNATAAPAAAGCTTVAIHVVAIPASVFSWVLVSTKSRALCFPATRPPSALLAYPAADGAQLQRVIPDPAGHPQVDRHARLAGGAAHGLHVSRDALRRRQALWRGVRCGGRGGGGAALLAHGAHIASGVHQRAAVGVQRAATLRAAVTARGHRGRAGGAVGCAWGPPCPGPAGRPAFLAWPGLGGGVSCSWCADVQAGVAAGVPALRWMGPKQLLGTR
jgi:hypothetical protein